MLNGRWLRSGLAFLSAFGLAGSAQALTINTPNVTLSGGSFDEIILLTGATDFTLSGGTLLGDFTALNGTTATITGGILEGDLLVPGEGAIVEIVGVNFLVDGSDSFSTPLTADICGVDGCVITGTLENGDPISITGYALRTGQIRLVPEPATVLVVGLGLLGLAWVGRPGRSRR